MQITNSTQAAGLATALLNARVYDVEPIDDGSEETPGWTFHRAAWEREYGWVLKDGRVGRGCDSRAAAEEDALRELGPIDDKPAPSPAGTLQWRWQPHLSHNEGDSDWADWDKWEDVKLGVWEFDSRTRVEFRVKPDETKEN